MYEKVIENIHPTKPVYSRDLVLVCKLEKETALRAGDENIFISEFVVAKILGYIKHLRGHPEVTKTFLKQLPEFLKEPKELLVRPDRPSERYLICGTEKHRVVFEIRRDGVTTQINTIHPIKESKLRRLRKKCNSL